MLLYLLFDFGYSPFNSDLNGVYHWLANSSQVVVCFDMSNETFSKMNILLLVVMLLF